MTVQILKGIKNDWEVVIGLEVHAQLSTASKLFSGSATTFGAEPNTQVSFVDAAMPGMLPVLNAGCIKKAIQIALGLNAKINKVSKFDRKNYFYADLPQGYQISQFFIPIMQDGFLFINDQKKIKIERAHIEQDAGKSIHDRHPNESYIDLNRSGMPLIEIVTAPDIRSSEEAGEFMRALRSLLCYLDASTGNMEEGALRCDANVSVRPKGSNTLGTRVEIKNINSVRNVIKAINVEAERQVFAIESGVKIVQETRLFDVASNETRSMRSKEDAPDYRYFPDPDLPPIIITEEEIEALRKALPEMPAQKQARYMEQMKLSQYDASVLTADKEVSLWFEKAAAKVTPKLAANWLVVEVFGKLNKLGIELKEMPLSVENFIKLLQLIEKNVISGKIAKTIFEIIFDTNEDPKEVIEREGLVQVTDQGEISKIITDVLSSNPNEVKEYKSGKDKLFGFFVGQVMKLSGGKASPSLVNQLLKQELDKL